MNNPQELKQAIYKALAEKGDYGTILNSLSSEEKETKFTKLITPISAFADLLTENTKGAFLEDVNAKVDTETKKALKDLSEAITEARSTLESELRDLMQSTKSEAISEHLARYQEAETTLTNKMMELAVEVATAKADELFPKLASEAKLTEDEIEDIIETAALSVESQMSNIVGEYLADQQLTSSQITDFAEAVRRLIPPERQVTWDSIVGKPDISQGGTNTNVVRKMIAEIKLNDLSDVTVSATDPATADGTFWVDIS
jgi:hypothetical protein